MANQIDYVSDWGARLRTRLYAQFASAPTWQAWCEKVLGPQFQDLEDAAQTFLTLLDIDNSVGVQLDVIGRIVGQVRSGTDDPTYRLYLKARILANLSTGTVEELYGVFLAMLGNGIGLIYKPGKIKQFSISIALVLTRIQALLAVKFLGDSKEAGARGLLEWKETADSSMFTFDSGGLGFDVGYLAGAAEA